MTIAQNNHPGFHIRYLLFALVPCVCSCAAPSADTIKFRDRVFPSEFAARLARAEALADVGSYAYQTENGGTATVSLHEGVDAYRTLLRDPDLSQEEKLSVAESAEAHLGGMATHRSDMEQDLAAFYFNTGRYEKADKYARIVLEQSGAILDSVYVKMVTIRAISSQKIRPKEQYIAVLDQAIAETKRTFPNLTKLTTVLETLKRKALPPAPETTASQSE